MGNRGIMVQALRKRGGRAGRRGISRELDCILVARDRSGQTIDALAGRGVLTVARLERHLLPKLDRQVLRVSDATAAYRAFSRKHGIAHEAVNLSAGERVQAAVGKKILDACVNSVPCRECNEQFGELAVLQRRAI